MWNFTTHPLKSSSVRSATNSRACLVLEALIQPQDIEGITIGRWAHGYAYGYNSLFDPDFAEGEAPNEVGRKPFGRIAIANSDAGAIAYMDTAINEAYRAVQELAHYRSA